MTSTDTAPPETRPVRPFNRTEWGKRPEDRADLHFRARRFRWGFSRDVMTCDGQLVSIEIDGQELLHQGGQPWPYQPGKYMDKQWPHSEMVLFPVIGTVKNFTVHTKKGQHVLDEHGISRAMSWKDATDTSINTLTFYQENRPKFGFVYPWYKNPLSEASIDTVEKMQFKHDFKITKTIGYVMHDDAIKVSFQVDNKGHFDMPYMFGWQAAYQLQGKPEDAVLVYRQLRGYTMQETTVPFKEIVKESLAEGAMRLDGVVMLGYRDLAKSKGFQVEANGFTKAMIWTPGWDSNILGIAHVTHFPVPLEKQAYFHPEHDLKAGNLRPDIYELYIKGF